ncbi:IS3 family transposase [Streptomyces sp. NPDC088910]|uniref:IS3 family transposase n=1 Tax=Streptomyces sp. NPDC088910 TaxID=3365911 RepID=UPI0038132E3E
MSRFQFVADHQRRYGVKRLCAILGIARSSFYSWHATAGARSARQAADAHLAARIREVHRESDGTHGVPRITAEFRKADEYVNYKRIARVMRKIPRSGFSAGIVNIAQFLLAATRPAVTGPILFLISSIGRPDPARISITRIFTA